MIIDFNKRQGGGGEGSEVHWVQKTLSGENIADITIDSTTYHVYAPEGGGYELPIASTDTLGGVKVGSGLTIDAEGVLSANGGGEGGDCNYRIVDSLEEIADPQEGMLAFVKSTETVEVQGLSGITLSDIRALNNGDTMFFTNAGGRDMYMKYWTDGEGPHASFGTGDFSFYYAIYPYDVVRVPDFGWQTGLPVILRMNGDYSVDILTDVSDIAWAGKVQNIPAQITTATTEVESVEVQSADITEKYIYRNGEWKPEDNAYYFSGSFMREEVLNWVTKVSQVENLKVLYGRFLTTPILFESIVTKNSGEIKAYALGFVRDANNCTLTKYILNARPNRYTTYETGVTLREEPVKEDNYQIVNVLPTTTYGIKEGDLYYQIYNTETRSMPVLSCDLPTGTTTDLHLLEFNPSGWNGITATWKSPMMETLPCLIFHDAYWSREEKIVIDYGTTQVWHKFDTGTAGQPEVYFKAERIGWGNDYKAYFAMPDGDLSGLTNRSEEVEWQEEYDFVDVYVPDGSIYTFTNSQFKKVGGGTYTAGTGIDITNNVISCTVKDNYQLVTDIAEAEDPSEGTIAYIQPSISTAVMPNWYVDIADGYDGQELALFYRDAISWAICSKTYNGENIIDIKDIDNTEHIYMRKGDCVALSYGTDNAKTCRIYLDDLNVLHVGSNDGMEDFYELSIDPAWNTDGEYYTFNLAITEGSTKQYENGVWKNADRIVSDTEGSANAVSKIWTGTAAEYAALIKNNDTLYIIV